MPKLVSVHVMRSDMKAERDIAAATRRGRRVSAARKGRGSGVIAAATRRGRGVISRWEGRGSSSIAA